MLKCSLKQRMQPELDAELLADELAGLTAVLRNPILQKTRPRILHPLPCMFMHLVSTVWTGT